MANTNKFLFEPLRTVAFGGISGTYAAVGNPLANTCIWAYFYNATDASVIFSLGGNFDGPVVPASGYLVVDMQTNRDGDQESKGFAQNAQIYVKQLSGAPTTGAVYVTLGY